MTIFQAPEYDFKKARRRKINISIAVAVVLVLCIFAFIYRNWPEERIANKFFTALQHQDYKQAYGIWIVDPNWEQKPPLARYTFNDFYRDWGPSGDWGEIKSFKIDGSTRPKGSNGVVVIITINGRKEPATIFVDKKDHSISFSPFEVVQ